MDLKQATQPAAKPRQGGPAPGGSPSRFAGLDFWLWPITGLMLTVATILALLVADPISIYGVHTGDASIPYKNFFLMVPNAWNAFLCFFLVLVGSGMYLRTHNRRWDTLAFSSAQVGVLFTCQTLVVGVSWAKPAWGAWWVWDPRPTTALIMLLMYAGYLLLRQAITDPELQLNVSAVFGILSFATVPLVFGSTSWWNSIHPGHIVFQMGALSGTQVLALNVSIFAYTFLVVFLIRYRMKVEYLTQSLQRRLRLAHRGGNA